MLILAPRVGETVLIGDERSVAVHREENYERLKREHAEYTINDDDPTVTVPGPEVSSQ